MEKGKLGLRVSFYGVVGFILAFMGYSTLLFLLLGVVLLVEKNEWATRQVIQALCLCLIASFISSILNITDFAYNIPFISSVWSTILNIINSLIDLIVFIFCLVGLFANMKGNDANIPLAGKFADWALGIVNQAPNFNQAQGFNQQPNNFNQTQGFNQQPNNFNQAQGFNQQPNNFNQAQGFNPQPNNFNQAQQPNQNQQPDQNQQPTQNQ